jgi:radical SAM protein with 4Fe4S-binding SPASM domain
LIKLGLLHIVEKFIKRVFCKVPAKDRILIYLHQKLSYDLKAQMMKKKFSKVNIEISNICNLQCSFCPEVLRTKKMMDVELFRKIIQQVKPLTDQVCFHLMGDPLVHPKLSEFVEICSEYEMPIFFVSNGVLLKDSTIDLLMHSSFRQLNFSLHSFFDNYPDKNPDLYLKKIFDLTEKAFLIRPDLYINYRLWNLQETRGHQLKNTEMLRKIMLRFDVSLISEVDVKKNKSHHIKNRLYMHYDTEFTWPTLELPSLGEKGTCYGLSNHFGILADGTVVPCCLDKEGKIPLGHLNDSDLDTILNSEKAQSLLKGFKSNRLVNPLCQRCNYIERFQ